MNEATLKNSLAIPHKVDSYCTSVKKKKSPWEIFFFLVRGLMKIFQHSRKLQTALNSSQL